METTVVFETADSFKADQVEALFKSNAVDYVRKNFGAGPQIVRVFGSSSCAGIQILVRTEDEQKAKALLQGTGFITE
ncbi:MAG: hypothetical protein ACSW73_03805 [Spirochaetales bacterium]